MSRIDVVIPCYNYAHYLRGCVESVLGQEGVELRVLILDDCSPDRTPEVAAELARADSRVEYRRHAVNKGHIDTYNEGLLEWASGDYVLLLSADDLLAPGALGRAARVLDAHPEVGLVHGRQRLFEGEPGPVTADETGGAFSVVPGVEFIEGCCAAAHNPVSTPTAVVRTSLQHQVGGYRKSLPHTADMDMWLRYAARSAVARVEALQAFKRMHAGNMQHQYLTSALADLSERRDTFAVFFAEHGHLLEDGERLHAGAVRRLAEDAFWSGSQAFDDGDEAGCRRCLEFALALCPGLTATKAWARLRWKRRLGRRAWGLLRPWLRGSAAAAPS
jgi:glycosyltransferase involved in cell wall biosynthesis